jgi:predicted membrane protein
MNKKIVNSQPFLIVVLSIFAALDAVVRLVPATYAIGLYKFFSLGWVFSPIMGVLIGPFAGFSAAILGSLIRASIAPYNWTFGPFSPFLPAISALQAGLLTRKKHSPLFALIASAILFFLMLTWLYLPTGQIVWPVALYYLAGLALIPLVRICLNLSGRWLIISLILTAYVSNITQHALGNVLSVALLNLPAEVFWAALPLPLIEQTAFALGSGIVAYPVLIALQKANLLQYLRFDLPKRQTVTFKVTKRVE